MRKHAVSTSGAARPEGGRRNPPDCRCAAHALVQLRRRLGADVPARRFQGHPDGGKVLADLVVQLPRERPAFRLPNFQEVEEMIQLDLPTTSILFTILWDALADLLGTAATATLLKGAARRAAARSPELAGLVIKRDGLIYRYTCPSN